MPHRDVTFDPWIENIRQEDSCLGRILIEAVVMKDAAVKAGAASRRASKKCFKKFESAETTLETIRTGKIKPNTDIAWKRASDALRKFTEALECVGH
jgi:phage tail tube protein FII